MLKTLIHVQMCCGLFSWQDNSREWNSDLHWLLYQCCNTVTRHAMWWEIIVMIYSMTVDIHGPPILLHDLKTIILSVSFNLCLIIHDNWPNDLNISIFIWGISWLKCSNYTCSLLAMWSTCIYTVMGERDGGSQLSEWGRLHDTRDRG